MGQCISQYENKDNNNNLNSKKKKRKMLYKSTRDSKFKNWYNNSYFNYSDNKENVSPYNKSLDLNINQKGDINNYSDIKKFEELQ